MLSTLVAAGVAFRRLEFFTFSGEKQTRSRHIHADDAVRGMPEGKQ